MAIIRRAELVQRIGLSYTTIWRRMKAGTFPQRVQIGQNSIGWKEADIEEWENSLPYVGAADNEEAA